MYADSSQAQSYFELAGLNRLRRLTRENNSPEAIKAVAAEFESMFLRMMLKSMRETGLGDPLFDSDSTMFYRDMADQQLAVDMAKQGGIGLADMLVRQLSGPYAGVTVRRDENKEQAAFPVDESRFRPDLSCHVCAPSPQAESSTTATPKDGNAQQADEPDLQQAAAGETREARPAPARTGRVAYAETLRAVAQAKASSQDDEVVKQSESPKLGSPDRFVAALWPSAQKAAKELGVKPEVLLAQAALETGWGKAVIRGPEGKNSHNLFNIKADGRWDGERVAVSTLEYRDGVAVKERHAFRAYDSYEESFDDYVAFLKASPRYQKALAYAFDPRAFVRELQDAGYATDPGYAAKIQRIMNGEPMAGATAGIEVSQAGTRDRIGG